MNLWNLTGSVNELKNEHESMNKDYSINNYR